MEDQQTTYRELVPTLLYRYCREKERIRRQAIGGVFSAMAEHADLMVDLYKAHPGFVKAFIRERSRKTELPGRPVPPHLKEKDA